MTKGNTLWRSQVRSCFGSELIAKYCLQPKVQLFKVGPNREPFGVVHPHLKPTIGDELHRLANHGLLSG